MHADFRYRLKWSVGHFLVSCSVMLVVGGLIFFVWYPHPYRLLSGGLSLFVLVTVVDLVLGPFCTFAVASVNKALSQLRMDVALIAVVQVAALSYGVLTVFQARPVYLAFEIDRLRVVHAVDVDAELLSRSAPEFRELPVWGPKLVAVRPFASSAEKTDATMAALQGVDIGSRADLWTSYASQAEAISAAALPLATLVVNKPQEALEIEAALGSAGLKLEEARYLPVVSRQSAWTAILSPQDTRPVQFLPIDPY
jgi:hypothetical protein